MRLPLTLYLIALVARVLSGALHPDPAYPDSTYYVAVARSLAAGQGFSVDFIWNFVDVGGRVPADPMLPIPSNAHWMPLASLVQVPFLMVFGGSALVAFIPFALIGATAAPLAWGIARDAGLNRWGATAAGLMTAVPGSVTPFLGQPDNFALFMPLGALALWLCARGLRGDRRAFVVGGFVVGLATLARNDGVLLGVPFALGWLDQRWPRRRAGSATRTPEHATEPVPRAPALKAPAARAPALKAPAARAPAGRLPLAAAVGCALLFLVVMAPWYARQLAAFGSLSPSASSGRILWITSYPQLFSVSGDPTLASFLAQGLGPILVSRLAGIGAALLILAAVPFLFFLVPFVLWGAWSRRRSTLFGPWLLYGGLLLLLSGLLFAVHVPYGTFLHSAVALVPHGYVLAVDGIALAVAWAARRLRHWDVPRATRVFTAVAVAVLWAVGAAAAWKASGDWDRDAGVRQAAAASIASVAARGDRLMSADPGAYRYYTGLGGVVTPQDPLETVESVARAYGVRWLVLEPAHIVDSLAPLYLGTQPLPAWLNPASQGSPSDALPSYRIYAVCLNAEDPRAVCQAAQR